VSMVQIGASIEYETALPPADLPDDMKALPGASLQFLSLKAIDGFKVRRALATGKQAAGRDDDDRAGPR
jgi:hypothetical protein